MSHQNLKLAYNMKFFVENNAPVSISHFLVHGANVAEK